MANKKKDIDKKISQGGFVQHPDSGDRLPDVVMQMPHLFYLDTYQWTQAVSSAKQWDFTRRRQLYDMYEHHARLTPPWNHETEKDRHIAVPCRVREQGRRG